MITQQGGQLFKHRQADLAAIGAPAQRLRALAEYLEGMGSDTTVWCHSSLNGIVLDAEDDYRTGFGRVDWERTRYRLEMHWPMPSPPSDQHLVWAGAHAQLIGFPIDLPHTSQMLVEMIAYAPRAAPAIRMRAMGLEPVLTDLVLPVWSPVHPTIEHHLNRIRSSFVERSHTTCEVHALHAQRMVVLLDYLKTTKIADIMWIDHYENGISLMPEHVDGEIMMIVPELSGYAVLCWWFPHFRTWKPAIVKAHTQDIQMVSQLVYAAYTYK